MSSDKGISKSIPNDIPTEEQAGQVYQDKLKEPNELRN
jgi:hypothetical protein